MADNKLTALAEAATIATTDIVYSVSDPGGSPVSKKITFDNLQKSITDVASINSAGNIVTSILKYFYLGDETTDGSWRIGVTAGNLTFEKRVSGSWESKGAMG